MSYSLKPEQIPCKFGEHFSDSVPMPFGSGNCEMPGFECTYDGDKEIPDEMVCNEDKSCPAYEPVPTSICQKHDIEHYGGCYKCEDEAMGIEA